MVRDTSVQAYREIADNGLLTKQRFEVYHALFERGPCTAGELFLYLNRNGVKGSICARLTELREQGVVREMEPRECLFSHKTAIVWDVTSNLPSEYKKKKKRFWYLTVSDNGWVTVFSNKRDAELRVQLQPGLELVKVTEVS